RVGEERAAAEAAAERARRPAPAPRPNDRAPKAKGFSTSQRRELDEIPVKIEAGEARLAEIDARMGDPALYRGTTRELAAIQAERAAASKDLDRLYARWEQLEALRAAESG
ncbi:MAG: ABC transporter ATP-binding protein, partial [Planctomycetes bacterium]|nr:ABC transporter ATP-binding protein [Planctomycetota bacterium]